MRGAFSSVDADMSDDAWAIAFADHLARCGGDASVHTALSWLVTALAEIISEVRGALGVGVEVLTDPTMLVQLSYGNDGLPADVGVLHYHGIRGSKLALDDLVSGLFGVSSPPLPEVALRHAEKTKFEKYSEEVRSRPDIRFIPFPVTGFGTLGGHATAFLTELAKQAAASKGITAFLKCRKRAFLYTRFFAFFFVHAKTTSRANYHPRVTDCLHAPKYVASTLLRP
jgi:hypothetical protein